MFIPASRLSDPGARAAEPMSSLRSCHETQRGVRVLALATESGCGAYDCEFVAVAQDLGLPLVTADVELLAKFKPTAVSMRAFCAG